MRSVLTVFCLLGVVNLGDSLQFTPSSLASKLQDLGVIDWDIPSLVCLAHNASNLNTNFTTYRADLEYFYYGIFGIPHPLFNHTPCIHLNQHLALDDDITDDVKCVVNMIVNSGYLKKNRTDSLLVFTPYEVDLGKCFDWWATLPPYSSSKSLNAMANCTKVDFPLEITTASTAIEEHCPSVGYMTNFLLFSLIACVIVLCVIAYFVLVQYKLSNNIKRCNENMLL